MIRSALVARSVLALAVCAGTAHAQLPRLLLPRLLLRQRAPPSLRPPAAAGAAGPDAPVGKVTQELQAKLENMMKGNGLTSDEVARRAVKSSSQLAAKRQAVESADASLDEALAGFLPTVNLTARYTRLSDIPPPSLGSFGGGGTLVVSQNPNAHPVDPNNEQLFAVVVPPITLPIVLNNYVLQAQLSVPISDYLLRLSRAKSGAKRVKTASEYDEKATRLSVARDARVAYYQWIRAQGMAFVGAQAVEQAKGHLADANNAFQAGLVSKADVLRAQSGVKSAELFFERATSGVQLATARLRMLMRDDASKQYEVGENILAPVAPLPGTASEAAAYNEAAQQRVELKQLRETEQAVRDQAALVGAAGYPRLDARAGAEYSNPNPRYFPPQEEFHGTWDASIVLSWTPTAIFGAKASARVLDAKAAELVAQRQALLDGLQLEVAQALNAERDAQFAVTVTQQALAAADEGYRVRRELFRSGRATLVEVTDSETELTRARLELVNAHVDLRIAQVELAHVLGRDAK